MIKEFRDFIARGNVMDMAVGIIIGAAFTAIVSSLVADIINPVIGLFTGGIDFTDKYLVLSGEVAAGTGLDAARESGAAIFAWGKFVMAVINVLLVAWVVFVLVKMVNRVKDAAVRKDAEPVTATEPAAPPPPSAAALLTEIRDLLKERTA